MGSWRQESHDTISFELEALRDGLYMFTPSSTIFYVMTFLSGGIALGVWFMEKGESLATALRSESDRVCDTPYMILSPYVLGR